MQRRVLSVFGLLALGSSGFNKTATLLSPRIETLQGTLTTEEVKQFLSSSLGLAPQLPFESDGASWINSLEHPEVVVLGVVNEFTTGLPTSHKVDFSTQCESLTCLVREVLPPHSEAKVVEFTPSEATKEEMSKVELPDGVVLPTAEPEVRCSELALAELATLKKIKYSLVGLRQASDVAPTFLFLTPVDGVSCFHRIAREGDVEIKAKVPVWCHAVSTSVNVMMQEIVDSLHQQFRTNAAILTFHADASELDLTCPKEMCPNNSLFVDSRRLQEVTQKPFTSVTESQAQKRQIVIWVSVLLVFIVFFVVSSMLNMATTKDPLLYTKLAAAR